MYIEQIEPGSGPKYEGMPEGVWYWLFGEEKLPSNARFPEARLTAAGSFALEPQNLDEEISDDIARLEFKCTSEYHDPGDLPARYDFELHDVETGELLDEPFIWTLSVLAADVPERIQNTDDPCYLTLEIRYDRERTGGTPALNARTRGDIDYTTSGVHLLGHGYPERARYTDRFLIDGTCLYAQYRNRNGYALGALDLETGEELWWRTDYLAAQQLQVVNDTLCIHPAADQILGIDVASGTRRWSMTTDTDVKMAAASDTLVLAGEHVRGVDPATASTRWERSIQAQPWTVESVGDTVVLIGHADRITAFDAGTGERLWERDLAESTGLNAVNGSPGADNVTIATGGGVVVLADDTRTLTALAADTGEQQWRTNYEGDRDWLAATEVAVLVAIEDGPDQAFDPTTGDLRWRHTITGNTPQAIGDTLYFDAYSDTKIARAYSLATGQLAWRYEVKWRHWVLDKIRGMATDGDRLCLHTNDSELADGPRDHHFELLAPTGSTQRQFRGVVDEFSDDELARIDLTPIEDTGDDEDAHLQIPRGRLPWYGAFEQAHYHVVLGTAPEYEAVSGERQRASAQITEFELTVDERDDDTVRLSLTPLDEELPEGSAVVPADGLAEDCREPGATGYTSIHLIYDEEATPDEAIPESYQ
jgi:outer membrane protein assembly factor BamB